MGKHRRERGSHSTTDWESERTMADAEAEAAMAPEIDSESTDLSLPSIASIAARPSLARPAAISDESHQARCACGSEEFLLEAFIAVVRGRPQPEPVEMEALTCPQCGREYEAIWLANGQIARGEFRGQSSADDE